MFKFTQHVSMKATPQSQPIPGSSQVINSAGGYVWSADDWVRLDRFLILGTEGGTYHIGEAKLTIDNAAAVLRCLAADGARAVARIAEISDAGRAAQDGPAVLRLAPAAQRGPEPTRRAAHPAPPRGCRTGTHLMHFAEYAQAFGGWGRGMRKAVAGWFNARPANELALQLVKYQARDGWSTRDLLRLAHPRAASPSHDRLFAWVTKGALPAGATTDPALALLVARDALARVASPHEAANVIRTHRVPREAVPTELLAHAEVWEALLADMPMTALLRNLATMTRVGLLAPGANATKTVVARLGDNARLAKARVHPVAALAALLTYKSGHGARGAGTWTPVTPVIDALDAAFYATFPGVEPAGKRMLLALDVSGSMSGGTIAGVPGLTPRVGSAAMALVTAATERDHTLVGFSAAATGIGGKWGGGVSGLTPLAISPRQRLDDAVRAIEQVPMGGTDCALPMLWAARTKVDVDTFVVYTDNETWAGSVHPAQALRAYREARGIPAKLVVVGMTSNGFTIADPDDAGMLDVVGFDTATPPVISDFARA